VNPPGCYDLPTAHAFLDQDLAEDPVKGPLLACALGGSLCGRSSCVATFLPLARFPEVRELYDRHLSGLFPTFSVEGVRPLVTGLHVLRYLDYLWGRSIVRKRKFSLFRAGTYYPSAWHAARSLHEKSLARIWRLVGAGPAPFEPDGPIPPFDATSWG